MSKKQILFLSSEDIHKALSMKQAIAAMKDAFIQLSSGRAKVPLRTPLEMDDRGGSALFMPVYLPDTEKVGIKTVTVFKDNPLKNLPMIHAMFTVFDARDGKPMAVMDGESLTAIRTGAASGLATDLLARKDTSSVYVIGAGTQSRAQLEAVCTVRDIKEAWVMDLNLDRAIEFAVEMGNQLKLKITAQSSLDKLSEADVICTATSSYKPVFKDSQTRSGTHINGIGSFKPNMQEIPSETVKRAFVVVDSKEACLAEAGDLVIPIKEGTISQHHIYAEIGEIAAGRKVGRSDEDQITFFKSVGNAAQDLAAASAVLEFAQENKLGQLIDR